MDRSHHLWTTDVIMTTHDVYYYLTYWLACRLRLSRTSLYFRLKLGSLASRYFLPHRRKFVWNPAQWILLVDYIFVRWTHLSPVRLAFSKERPIHCGILAIMDSMGTHGGQERQVFEYKFSKYYDFTSWYMQHYIKKTEIMCHMIRGSCPCLRPHRSG